MINDLNSNNTNKEQNIVNEKIITIFNDLKFISNIPENTKPCFRDKTYIDTNSWFVTVKRRFKGEKGEKGVIYINDLIDSCDHIYRMCKDLKVLKKLRKSLYDSKNGVKNLIFTYNDQDNVRDGYLKCFKDIISLIVKLDEKIDKITDKIIENQKYLKFISSMSDQKSFFKYDKFHW